MSNEVVQIEYEESDEPILPPPPSLHNSINYAKENVPLLNNQNEEAKGSVGMVILTVFLQSMGFTIVIPSLSYFVLSLGGSQTYYGWIVASYSLGQFIGSPLFASYSNYRPSREVLVISLIFSAIANFLYAVVPITPHGLWMMLVSRFLVGFGAGNVSVCRAYASEATPLAQKGATMAKMSGSQGVGFVLGPGIGYLLALMDFNIAGIVPINKYTGPGYFLGITAIINAVVVAIKFKEIHKPGEIPTGKTPKKEMIPILVSIFLFFVIISVFAVFETCVTLLTRTSFNWGVEQNAILLFCVGIIGIVVFVLMSRPFIRKYDDRKCLFVGFLLQLFALIALVEWTSPRLQKNYTYEQLFIGAVFEGIGYPMASTFMYTVFSKVLNPKFQGTKMGWLTAGGSLARMLGPIWATKSFDFGGSELLFLTTAALVFIALLVNVIFYKQLTPHPDYGKATIQPPVIKPGLSARNYKALQ
eukprot:TRINITY_DN2235_c0_g1_i6.p1 TRINITY_DN2235_c0_g1~~TRINITY_DN2235_c0_g1_i6.p1  ORF type:complete len:473 (-),score=90.16 TRINITY_DN2235_c0_g1_i6:68-1486(-)